MKQRRGIQPLQSMTGRPALAMAAPAMPATSAWEELVGNARSQVMMFQMMAPKRPAKTTKTSTWTVSIRPVPMVLATVVPKMKAATKLKKAAQATATVGERTRVETMVAMELAASWKPLRKSKTRATKMMKMMSVSMPKADCKPIKEYQGCAKG